MDRFFTLNSLESNYEISIIEKNIPIFMVIFIISILYLMKDKIKANSKIDINIRYITAIISLIFLSLYYILEWSSNGINLQNLPLHICFISNALCILLCFTKSKSIFNFVVFAGILGGISSLLAPELNLSFKYFRYYQFMVCHCSIIIIPIYFLFVYKYTVNIKYTIKVILIIEVLGLCLGIFNEIYDTSYMFVSFTSNKAAKDSILFYIGNGFNYFINLQFLFLLTMSLWYFILNQASKYIIKKQFQYKERI